MDLGSTTSLFQAYRELSIVIQPDGCGSPSRPAVGDRVNAYQRTDIGLAPKFLPAPRDLLTAPG